MNMKKLLSASAIPTLILTSLPAAPAALAEDINMCATPALCRGETHRPDNPEDCTTWAHGCIEVPEEFRDDRVTYEQQEAWNKCVAAGVIAGIPAAKAANTIKNAILSGSAAAAGNMYVSCDFDAIAPNRKE